MNFLVNHGPSTSARELMTTINQELSATNTLVLVRMLYPALDDPDLKSSLEGADYDP
ncbi:MAG: hypothetical protein H7A28_07380 [Thermotogae bacterium]|nr:hypothetical protein [Thermotogota bacterium]